MLNNMDSIFPSKHQRLDSQKRYKAYIDNPDIPALFYKKLEADMQFSFATIPVIFYDGTVESAQAYIEGIFNRRAGSQNIRYDDAKELLAGYFVESFCSFCHNIELKYNNSFFDIIKWAKIWRDVSIDLVKDSYVLFPEYEGKVSNLGIAQYAIRNIYNSYIQYISELSVGTWADVSDIPLYDYESLNHKCTLNSSNNVICPSIEEYAKNDIVNNNYMFANRVNEYITDVMKDKMDIVPFYCDLRDTIHQLFVSYIKRVDAKSPFNVELLKFATEYWKDSTDIIISNAIYSEIQYRFMYNFNKSLFKRRAWLKSQQQQRKLLVLYSKVFDFLSFTCDLYKNDYLAKLYNKPWSLELSKLNLHYRKMYECMNGTYFSGLKYEQFKYCFESADMSLLRDKAKDKNAYAAIKYMVVKIGVKCKIWFSNVSSTLVDDNGNKYSEYDLIHLVRDDRKYAKDFRQMMLDNDIDFPFK